MNDKFTEKHVENTNQCIAYNSVELGTCATNYVCDFYLKYAHYKAWARDILKVRI